MEPLILIQQSVSSEWGCCKMQKEESASEYFAFPEPECYMDHFLIYYNINQTVDVINNGPHSHTKGSTPESSWLRGAKREGN